MGDPYLEGGGATRVTISAARRVGRVAEQRVDRTVAATSWRCGASPTPIVDSRVCPDRAAAVDSAAPRRLGSRPRSRRGGATRRSWRVRRAVGHQRPVRQHHRVGLGVRAAGAGTRSGTRRGAPAIPVRRGVPGEKRPERHVAAVRAAGEAPRRLARRPQRGQVRPPGWRTACRAPPCAWARAFMALAASAGVGAEAITAGSATTSEGRTSRAPSDPRGRAVEGGHLGAGQRGGTAARPEPGRTRDGLGGVDHAAAAQGHDGRPVARPSRAADSLVHRPGAREAPAPHARRVPGRRPARARWSAG